MYSTNYVYKSNELTKLDEELTKYKQKLRKQLDREPAKDTYQNPEDITSIFLPQLNKRVLFGMVEEWSEEQQAYFNRKVPVDLEKFSLGFQIDFIKATFISRKVDQV